MGLIRYKGKKISVASKNGYTLEKVRKCKEYLDKIGKNRRHFPLDEMVRMYNEIKGTNVVPTGCKPCQANKYYAGLQNYYTYGKMTLIANGIASETEIDETVEIEPLEMEVLASNSGLTVEEYKAEVKAITEEHKEMKKKTRKKKNG